MNPNQPPATTAPRHTQAILLALLVTALWSSSWLLIKIGLRDMPALTFAGLRYSLAFLLLLPFNFKHSVRSGYRNLKRSDWLLLALLGVLIYSVTQGAQFLGLSFLPMNSTSLLLNFTGVLVALGGTFLLGERLERLQWCGVLFNLAGVLIFFYPVQFSAQDWIGIGIVLVGVVSNSASALLGRQINRRARFTALLVTTVSMGIGGPLLLITGLLTQGMPVVTPQTGMIIFWLAAINTALAFSLWNYTQKTLQAMESTIINSTMLAQIALLGWLALGESLTPIKIIGMSLALGGVILTQLRKAPQPLPNPQTDI